MCYQTCLLSRDVTYLTSYTQLPLQSCVHIHMHTHLHIAKKKKNLAGCGGVRLYSQLPESRHKRIYEFKVSLVYMASSRPDWQWDPVFKLWTSTVNISLLPIAQCHVYLDLITRLHPLWAEAILSFLYIPSWLQDLAQKEQNMHLLMKIRCSGYYHLTHQWDHFKGKGWEEC